jgi:hypothetical protein
VVLSAGGLYILTKKCIFQLEITPKGNVLDVATNIRVWPLQDLPLTSMWPSCSCSKARCLSGVDPEECRSSHASHSTSDIPSQSGQHSGTSHGTNSNIFFLALITLSESALLEIMHQRRPLPALDHLCPYMSLWKPTVTCHCCQSRSP